MLKAMLGWGALVGVMVGSGLMAPQAIAYALGESDTWELAQGTANGVRPGATTQERQDQLNGVRGNGATGASTLAEWQDLSTGRGAMAGGGGGGVENPDQIAKDALDGAQKAAEQSRLAIRRGDWIDARAHAQALIDWLNLAARVQQPTGDVAKRWAQASQEARRLDAALVKKDATLAKRADAALTIALADARGLIGRGGGGGPTAPVETPTPDPSDPEVRYENVPLDAPRPFRQQ